MKLLLYCVKAKPILRDYRGKAIYDRFVISPTDRPFTSDDTQPILNGKIVAECDYEVEEIGLGYGEKHAMFYENGYFDDYYDYMTETLDEDILLKRSCLNVEEIEKYLGNKDGYAIHIKNLHIFDKPKDLRNYYTNRIYTKIEDVYTDEIQIKGSEWVRPIKKAPQNMMYARQTVPFKNEFLVKGILQEVSGYKVNEYILISIQPQWLCKILNGEKTIEIRKKVLKEMLKNV